MQQYDEYFHEDKSWTCPACGCEDEFYEDVIGGHLTLTCEDCAHREYVDTPDE